MPIDGTNGISKKRHQQPIIALDPNAYRKLQETQAAQNDPIAAKEFEKKEAGSLGILLKALEANQVQQASRLSFEVDPTPAYQTYAGLYRNKSNLTPDHIIKRIIGASGDDLVCQILQARSNLVASFGRPRMSRFSVGFEFQPLPGTDQPKDDEAKKKLQDRIDRAKKIFWNCGMGPAKKEYFTPNFSQYLKMVTRDGCAFGRMATEILSVVNAKTAKEEFYGFRPTDAGTIYHIVSSKETDDSLRQRAIQVLQDLKNEKIDRSKYERDEYKWVQVIDGIPRQAFSSKELLVHNLYPTTNVEYNGYPLTPIDQALNAITTHINITIHNKLYFQNGRAARGMLIFKSDNLDESIVQKVRLQFHQSINSAANSWRMPVFGVGAEDEIEWKQIDVNGRDAEFQYLMDSNARVILSSFQMSPEELPGYAHLSRGTNTQAMSESDNEWKLTAARDVGLRPLVGDVQDFLNASILPLIDSELAKTHQLILAGLEKESPEKESTRLQQDMNVHMTYNDVMTAVEKDPISEELGGAFPLNQLFVSTVVNPLLSVGEQLENFMKRKGASKDPRFNYYRDPFYFQQQQILMQKAQMVMQTQMQQQQMQAQAEMGPPPPEEEQAPPGADETQKHEITKRNLEKKEAWCAQNYAMLAKTTDTNARVITDMILARHKQIVDRHMAEWEKDSKDASTKILEAMNGKKGK